MTNEMFFNNLDAIVERLSKAPRAGVHVLNALRWSQLRAAYTALKRLEAGAGHTLYCEFCPETGCAVVHLRADPLLWQHNQAFPKELLLADNFEIYAVDDMAIQMDAMFYGVTAAIEGGR